MCGIVGTMQFGVPTTPAYNQSALYLTTCLLKASETRGKDATGIAALFEDGNFFVQKMAISSTEFVGRSGGKPDDYEGLLAFIRNYTQAPLRCIIGHCRKKSVGALNNTDNHPIKTGNILGVHNGTLKNDDEIFKNLSCERDGEVDSEAIFRLLEFFTNECKDPFTLDSLEEVCKRLEGTFSFLGFNANNPYQVVSARDGRPAEYCLIKPLGMVLVASEKKFIDLALYSYNEFARLFPTGNEQTEFVKLRQSDVEHMSLADNTMVIFDLTKNVTSETKLSDLYVTRKIPYLVDRMWKVASNIYNSGFGTNRFNNTTSTVDTTVEKKNTTQQNTQSQNTTTTSTETSTETTSTNNKKFTGRIWNSNLNKFVKEFGKKHLVVNGTVLDTERQELMTLSNAHVNAIKDTDEYDAAMKNTSEIKKTADQLAIGLTCVGADYPVEEYSTGENVKFTDKSPDVKQTTILKPNHSAGKAIIEMKQGIERGKKAIAGDLEAKESVILAAKNLKKFQDDIEIADFLGIGLTSLEELPPSALANRLIKKLFGKYFIEGWMDCYNKAQSRNNTLTDKLTRAEAHVRTLKTLQLGIIKEMTPTTEENLNIVAETARTLAETDKLSKETMQEIFSTGDFRESEVLRRIVTAL